MRPLKEPPIRWEMYLVAIVVAVSTYAVSTMGIRCQVDRLREVADRLESLTVSQTTYSVQPVLDRTRMQEEL